MSYFMIILIYIYQFIKSFLDKKCLFLRYMEPLKRKHSDLIGVYSVC